MLLIPDRASPDSNAVDVPPMPTAKNLALILVRKYPQQRLLDSRHISLHFCARYHPRRLNRWSRRRGSCLRLYDCYVGVRVLVLESIFYL